MVPRDTVADDDPKMCTNVMGWGEGGKKEMKKV